MLHQQTHQQTVQSLNRFVLLVWVLDIGPTVFRVLASNVITTHINEDPETWTADQFFYDGR